MEKRIEISLARINTNDKIICFPEYDTNKLNNEHYDLSFFTLQQAAYKNGTERLNISEITRFGQDVSRNQGNINGDEYKEGFTQSTDAHESVPE